MFDSGELRLVLLKLIEEQPRHGYDLIREIEVRTGGAYAPSPGVIYPTLTLLEDMGLVDEQQSEGTRRLFAITEAGRIHLKERAEEVEALLARLADVGEIRERVDGMPIRRAVRNLRTVVRNRMMDLSNERQHDIVEIIDEAARKIERLK
jgi:DNA-binding PadR family transcriptional regulator